MARVRVVRDNEGVMTASAPRPDPRGPLHVSEKAPLPPVPADGEPPRVLDSFRVAFSGVARTIASQRNMKLHMLSGLMVMIVGMALPLDLAMRVALLFAVGAVLFAEILNTGLEALIDLFTGRYHRLAMYAKDAAAAGVLVLSMTALLIFADVVWTRWELVTDHLDAVFFSLALGVPLVVSEAVGLFVIRRGALAIARLGLSAALLAPLVARSADPVYAVVAAGFVALSAYARWSFPRAIGRGAPGEPAA